jgi:group II intron reverse transcriptase/maturase
VDIGERQRKLNLWAEQLRADRDAGLFASRKDLRLYDLYHLVYEASWLRAAHDHVARNAGSVTAGCDGIDMARFDANLEENLQKLAEELRTQTFRPHPVRRVFIPKKDGKLRPLGIPSIRDRIVQECLRMILEPIFEGEFYHLSFGFRPNRSTIDALATVTHRASNKGRYFWVIEGDIKSYFDTIHHKKLLQLVRRRIRDKKLLLLVWRFLRAGVLEGTLFTPTQQGAPQGGILSPLLANVYLHELDMYLHRRSCHTRRGKERRRATGHGNFVHVRYADDFVVMCNGTKADAEAMKRDLQKFLAEELMLKLSEEKTKITHINDGFRFLGFDIRREITGVGVKLPKLLIPKDAVQKFRAKVLAITARSTCSNAATAKLIALNHYLRGWGNHYRYAYNASRVFAKLDHLVFWQMAHWLGAKFKCQMSQVMRDFYKRVDGVMTLSYGAAALSRMSSLSLGHPRQRTFTNPYAGPEPSVQREEVFGSGQVWQGNETRPGIEDLRPLVYQRDSWRCRRCRCQVTRDTARLDHVIPVKRFERLGHANYMDNLQTLCVPCHTQKSTGEID